MSNRLKNEHSPYLLQHAEDPIEWHPWGDEAFQKAVREDKPIFLSIGYSSCHWCHVMQRESFSDPAVAALLNEHFVAVKVDREERPDIDKHFQKVYQLMNGRPGGWPTSIFLTPHKKPFYSATYLPPEPRYGLMSFTQLLGVIAERYREEKELLAEKADEILRYIDNKEQKIQATKLDLSILPRFQSQAKSLFDAEGGGFGKAPKFPQTSLVSLLLESYRINRDTETLTILRKTLDSMILGGFYDLVDGGFCRYSTDGRWLVPHFEKMTYDNAQLSGLYLDAYLLTGDENYKRVVFETIGFMIGKMSERHLFYSASDADSEGGEGEYFVYSYDELRSAFAHLPGSDSLLEALGATQAGNFEGKNIIRLTQSNRDDIPGYADAIGILKGIQAQREHPFIDRKIILSWNAMMLKSLFKASQLESIYLDFSLVALRNLLGHLMRDGELYHTATPEQTPTIKAFLEDYAYLCDALIAAYETTLDETWLIKATELANKAIEKFYRQGRWNFSNGEFETDAGKDDISYPSSLSTMVDVLLSLGSLVDPDYRKFAFQSLQVISYDVMRQPVSSPSAARTVLRYLSDDIVIKASEENLRRHKALFAAIGHPFVTFKPAAIEGYMACTSTACFAHETTAEGCIAAIGKLYGIK